MGILTALKIAEKWMDEIEGVEGVGEGEEDGEPVINVMITNEEALSKLPKEVEGYRVVPVDLGSFHAQ